jgi:hypothetical protein
VQDQSQEVMSKRMLERAGSVPPPRSEAKQGELVTILPLGEWFCAAKQTKDSSKGQVKVLIKLS